MILLGTGAVTIGVGGALLLAQRRGVNISSARVVVVIAILLAIIVATAALGDNMPRLDAVFTPLAAIAIAVLIWYTYRSWRQTGWSPMTRRIALSVAMGVVSLATYILLR